MVKTILLLKAKYGGVCSDCGRPKVLDRETDPWTLNCHTTVPIPVWASIDAYAKNQYLRRFEIKVVPKKGDR